MDKKENMNAKEAKKYLESLERKLDQLAVIQELTEKEVGRVQKAVGKKSRLPVEMDTAFGILLLIATAASAFSKPIQSILSTSRSTGTTNPRSVATAMERSTKSREIISSPVNVELMSGYVFRARAAAKAKRPTMPMDTPCFLLTLSLYCFLSFITSVISNSLKVVRMAAVC